MKNQESSKKIVTKGVIVVASAIVLLVTIDLLNVLAFNGKPMFLINESDTKQSSILYDIYDCNGKKVYKFKGTKFNCPVDENKKVITITDKSEGTYCADAIEYYYKDYYFTCIKSQYVIVTVNGKEYTIKEALNNGIVTMDELIAAGFKPLKKSVTDDPSEEPTTPTEPTKPEEPTTPSEPSNPTEPTKPTTPTTPTEPTTPTTPTTPATPTTPTKPSDDTNKKKITITDTSAGKNCAQAIEYYYKRYYFNCIKSQYVIVTVNGKRYNIKEALNNGIVTMDELIEAGFKPQTDAVDR